METLPQPGYPPDAGAQGFLVQAATGRKPVLVEIEGLPVRFRSRLTWKDGKAVLAKPPGLNPWPPGCGHVRVRFADSDDREVRLKVVVPHAELDGGTAVFVCGDPEGLLKNRRKGDRYGVVQNSNLQLDVRGQGYRLVDLSLSGCRIASTAAQPPRGLPTGQVIANASLLLGPTVWVRLAMLVPRAHHGRGVGCEFKLAKDESSLHNMTALMDSLKQTPLSAFVASNASRRTTARGGPADS